MNDTIKAELKISAIVLIALLGGLNLAIAQEKEPSTPTVLPRPDFHYKGNVGRTYLESDPPQFPKPVQAISLPIFGQFSAF